MEIDDRPRLGLVHGMLDRPTVWDSLVPLLQERWATITPELPWGAAPSASGEKERFAVHRAFGGLLPDVVIAHSRAGYEVVREIVNVGGPGVSLLILIGWSNQTLNQSHAVIPPGGDELYEVSRSIIDDRSRVDGTTLSEVKRDWMATYAMRRFAQWDRNTRVDPADLTRVTSPTLLLLGEHDRMVHSNEIDLLARALPDVEVGVIEESSHWPMLEQPAALARAVHDFADRRGSVATAASAAVPR